MSRPARARSFRIFRKYEAARMPRSRLLLRKALSTAAAPCCGSWSGMGLFTCAARNKQIQRGFVMTKWIQSSLTVLTVLAGVAGTGTLRAQDPWHPADIDNWFQLAGLSQTSYMGVNLADIDSDRARALKLRDVHGVEITRIEDNSPAAKAGLKTGDVVLEYNGQRVEGMEQFGRFVRETPAGREVRLSISRDGNPQTVPVTLAARKNAMPQVFSGTWPGTMHEFQFNMPEINIDLPNVYTLSRTSMLGVEAESLNPQLAEFFGVKEGVLVRSVVKDSSAEKAGIKAGDVIV